ncbi:MAG: plastocyanin/azurin family copper-binding protein [Haloarculaceae archaeon]
MDRREFLCGVAGGGVLGLAGCLGSASSTEYDIGMSTRKFKPATFAVTPGTTVVWRNTSSQGHTVTAYEDGLPDGADYWASGGFDSEEAAREAWGKDTAGSVFSGETFEHTFEVPGEHAYFCIPHESRGMVGTVVVTEDATRTPRE